MFKCFALHLQISKSLERMSREHSYYGHCTHGKKKLVPCLLGDCILKSKFNLINTDSDLHQKKVKHSLSQFRKPNFYFHWLIFALNSLNAPKGICLSTIYCGEQEIQSVHRLKRLPDPKELNSNGAISETGAGSWAEMLAAGTSAHWKGQPCLFSGREDCGFFSTPIPMP